MVDLKQPEILPVDVKECPCRGPSSPKGAPPVPHSIGDEDELWKNANKLAKALVDEQTKSMNGSLDAMLIFVCTPMLLRQKRLNLSSVVGPVLRC